MKALQDLDRRVADAVKQFWQTREQQSRKQRTAGRSDQGARSAVTGGAQMDGFIDLLAELALEAGAFGRRRARTPGGSPWSLPAQ